MTQVKTGDLMVALRKHLAAPEWAFFEEVSNGTGYSGGKAYADVVAMSLWPSRGLQLHGMEVKVSRSDWQRERAKPSKAEIIAQYCDFWWLVTGPGVVHDEGEVPPAWGWKVWDGKKFYTKRQPTRTDAVPMDRQFLAALLRRASECGAGVIKAAVDAQLAADRERNERRLEEAIKYRTRDLDEIKAKVAAFEAESGIEITGWKGGAEIGKAVKLVDAIGVRSIYGHAHGLADQLQRASERINAALAEFDASAPTNNQGRAA